MNFEQAQSYLIGTVNETVSRRLPYRLERMRAFLQNLGNPQEQYPTVHIGGTSGKGSTCTMAASVLQREGGRVGLHTKPHLVSMTERARINGVPITQERFAELLTDMMPAIEDTMADYSRPSYYETLLALTFLYFAQEKIDIGVIEVGLGGMLDGTNVLTPLVTTITNVGMDHMDVLGDTLEAIAADKAGIAKPGVPLVCGVQQPGPRSVIKEYCERAGANFIDVYDVAKRVETVKEGYYGQQCLVQTPRGSYNIEMPLLGHFQVVNAAVAIVTMEQLPEPFLPSIEQTEQGLAHTSLAGRMEVFPSHPTVVFDIAHNPDKAQNLALSLLTHFGPDRRYTFVVAIGESKDAREILRTLCADLSGSFIFTSFEAAGRPAIKPQRLVRIAEDLGLSGRAINDPVEALSVARRNAGADDVVVVTGSTFIVADLRAWWLEHVAAETPAR